MRHARLFKIFGFLLATALLIACGSADGGPTEEDSTDQAALANNGGGGGGLSTACTACGCEMVFIGWNNGCRQYRCECDSTAKAQCVINKSGMAAAVSSPIGGVVLAK